MRASRTVVRYVGFFVLSSLNARIASCSYNQENRRPTLEHFIPQIPHTKDPDVETCVEWIRSSTKDFSILKFGPKDLIVMIAFLRLIGFTEISLQEISQNIASRKSFINHLQPLSGDAAPVLTTSIEEAFSVVKEIKNHRLVKSLYRPITDSINHALPSLMRDAQEAWKTGKVEQLYRTVANLSDQELIDFAKKFYPHANQETHEILCQNLKKAKIVCEEYISSQTHTLEFR